jgi:hypothetical protein
MELPTKYPVIAQFERQNYEAMVIAFLSKDNHLMFHVQSGYIVLDDENRTVQIKDEKTYMKVWELFDRLVDQGALQINREFPYVEE